MNLYCNTLRIYLIHHFSFSHLLWLSTTWVTQESTIVTPSVVLRATQRRREPSRTNGGLQKQLKDPAVFTHTPPSQGDPYPHSS